ncbi:hypothetical protein [Paracoccus sp. (in: a-proteobacteria)]|uniref:polysialyltransferase family glycosyltransferase n=1 Tax=Paracoccus sp. TaxID=267 RepID=UPI00322056C8
MTFRSDAQGGWDAAPDLYLPSNALTLLTALASALAGGHPAEMVYLEDGAPLPGALEAGIRRRFPEIAFSVRSDRAAIAEFANLPAMFPEILRRNLALSRGRPCRPAARPPSWLGVRYRTAHIYLSGNFVSKTLRRRCQTIVLREEGLANYHTLRFGPGRALLRLLSGRSPRRHIMGEEPWIDRIELDHPESLPPALRAKAGRLSFPDLLDRLPPVVARDLAALFWPGQGPGNIGRAALILTQPIEQTGFCSASEKAAIYAGIETRLRRAGYAVVIKRHPRETAGNEAGHLVIPAFFPIEAWPWLVEQKFELAVGLCTAALDRTGGLFSKRQLQLVDPGPFGRRDLTGWRERLEAFCAGQG